MVKKTIPRFNQESRDFSSHQVHFLGHALLNEPADIHPVSEVLLSLLLAVVGVAIAEVYLFLRNQRTQPLQVDGPRLLQLEPVVDAVVYPFVGMRGAEASGNVMGNSLQEHVVG